MSIAGRELSLYFHIPFCKKKCPYCHFYSVFPANLLLDNFSKALLIEIMQKKGLFNNKKIVSVYFGGGSPSILTPDFYRKILGKLPIDPDTEITLEANPDDVYLEKFRELKNIGINRISLGVQSLDEKLLNFLNRNHSLNQVFKALDDIRASGFNNISIDLMYDIPYQTLKTFENTLLSLENLKISHVSLYNLTFEENTPFYLKKELLNKKRPSDKTSLAMFNLAVKTLKSLGFKHYEISAFAKNNMLSKHNVGYWTAREFLGFGPSSFSYFEKKRFKNCSNLKTYFNKLAKSQSAVDFEEKLNYPNDVKELFLINLRLLDGLNFEKFQERVGNLPQSTLKTIERLKQDNFLTFDAPNIKLTEKGLLFYDTLAEEII
ncbi:MAG: radical SAM family heme chaperone HemW [Chlamydiae bacterium]|nr:radical SAM family heme chaperone HemW [Chlamydiota bacterium]